MSPKRADKQDEQHLTARVWRAITHPGWKVFAAILAAAASATTVVAVVSQVAGDSTNPCGREAASLGNVEIQERITLRQFLESTGASTDGYDPAELRQRVNRIQMDLSVAGYQGKPLKLEWTMIDASTNESFASPQLRNQGALEIEPAVCETNAQAIFRTPVPSRAAFIEIALKNDTDVLDISRTPKLEP